MKLRFFASDKPRERELASAVVCGAEQHGIDCDIERLSPTPNLDCDLACMVGVKSARLFQAARAAGALPLYFDKGYIRSRRPDRQVWEYWRISVGAHHPTGTTLCLRKKPWDRREALGLELQPWRRRGLQIVIAGSSAKYHEFYGLTDPSDYAAGLVRQLRGLTDRPIVYRPKPSWRDAVPIAGARYSEGKEGMIGALSNAYCLITHGSNACFEAALLGIPSIILGDGVAKPISSTAIEELETVRLGKRDQWLANLAYHQWTLTEFACGEAWECIGGWINELRA